MKISKDARVRPTRHDDVRINTAFGRYLGQMSQDEVHAAAFRYVEIKIAQEIHGRWEELRETLLTSLEINNEVREDFTKDATCAPAYSEILDYLRADRQVLDHELERTRLNMALCVRVLAALTDSTGYTRLMDDYDPERRQIILPLRFLEGSVGAVDRAWNRLIRLNEAWAQDMKSFDEKVKARSAFATSPGSVAIATLDGASGSSFEEWTARLLERDGCTIVQAHGGAGDRGADVIAICPDGRRIVLQCKHSVKPSSRISPRYVHQLNGTARPEHQADVVAMVTNRALSHEAHGFALRNGIHVVDRVALIRWATYGIPWLPALRADPSTTAA